MAVRVVGPLQWIVYPSLISVAATVILATPVKLFGLTLPEPVLPMVLAFSWPLIRPSVMAPVVLLGLGLGLDAFWHGPFGMWALALSAVYGVVLLSRSFLLGQETRVLFVWYAACTLMAFVLAYLIVTVSSPTAPSLLATIAQIAPTLLIFPLAHMMIERFDDGDVRFR
jgi:rod shape-determining protein MreD|tara:strand:+ start:39 stop:545 length:507 start_codon:yes stop_codon:yes gene_type:complete